MLDVREQWGGRVRTGKACGFLEGDPHFGRVPATVTAV